MKVKKGFATMDPEEQRKIASAGGKAAHAQGRAHTWTSETARAAGRKAHEGGRAHQFTTEEARAAGKLTGKAKKEKR